MMAPRLVELRRVLKPTGSIYLHCDPTASHYLKMLMDAVFGPGISATRSSGSGRTRKGLPINTLRENHDVILRFTKSETWTVGTAFVHSRTIRNTSRTFYPSRIDDGRRYRLADLTNPNQEPSAI